MLNLVERIQSLPPPNEVYASQACRDLADGYIRFEDRPPERLKGFPSPVSVHRVAGVGHLSSWRVRSARNVSGFVGRESEMAALLQAGDDTAGGDGRIVALTGDAGVGKSRLVHRFVTGLEQKGWRILEGECAPTLQDSPYAALQQLLGAILPAAGDVAFEGPDPLATLPSLWRSALDAVRDLPVRDEEWTRLEPRLRARAIADATAALIEKAVGDRPTVLLIEDLHWIDHASSAVIETLLSLTQRRRLMILLTSRPEALPAWLAHRNVVSLAIRPLDDSAGAAMLDRLLRDLPANEDLKRNILQHTGGVPLFMEEVCRRLQESHAARGKATAAEFARSLAELDVPPTVQGVIASRVDRLSSAGRGVLQLASAIVPRPSLALLRAVADLPEPTLREQLQALADSELLIETSLLPEHVFGFPHDLVRQVTYESMLKSTRRELHKSILAVLEKNASVQSDDTLCYHALRAENWQRGRVYAHRVARSCIAKSALADASYYFDAAMTAVDHLPASQDRERDAIDLRIESRMAFGPLGQFDRWLSRAKEAEERAGAIGDTTRKVSALAVRAAGLNFYGTPFDAIEASRGVLHQAELLGDAAWLSYVLYGLGQAYFISGRFRDAEQALDRACEKLSSPDARAPEGTTVDNVLLLCCVMKCASHLGLGEFETADLFRRRALEITSSSERPYDRIAAGYSNGMYLFYRGDLAAADKSLTDALAIAEQHEVRQFIPVVGCQLGIVLLEKCDINRARMILGRSRDEAEALGNTFVFLRSSLNLARAGSFESGDEMLQLAKAAKNTARQQGFEFLEAEALLAEAQILSHKNPEKTDAIGQLIEQSAAIAAKLEAKPHLERCTTLKRGTQNR